MANKELVYTVKIVDETGNIVEVLAQDVKTLNKSVKDLENELKGTELGSEQWKDLNAALGDTKRAMADVSEAEKKAQMSTEELASANKGLMGQFSSIPGPVGGVVKSVKGLGAAFKLLIANPVGLVIAAIALALMTLYKAFTSTKAGGEALEQVMAGLSAVMDVLRDRVLKVGGAIVKFFSGDFAGAADDLKGAFSGIGEEIAGEFNQAMALKKELQGIDDATRDLNMSRAAQNKLIAEAKLKINDENLSYAERQKALEEVRKAEVGLSDQEAVLAKRKYEAIKAQNALSDSSKEALEEEAQAFIAMQNAQLASLQKQKEIFDQQKALRDKEKAERKTAHDLRMKQIADLQKFEQDINLSLITDEQTRATKEAEIRKKAQLEQINALTTNANERARLRLLVEQKYQQDLKKIEDDAAKKNQEMLSAIDKLRIEFANNAVESERKRLLTEAELRLEAIGKEIDGLKITEEQKNQLKIEALNSYNEKREIINKSQDEKDLLAVKDKANKEFDERLKIEQLNLEAAMQNSLEYFDIQRDILDTNLAKELLMFEGNEKAQTAVKEKYANLRNDIDRAEQRAKLELLNGVLSAIASMAGEETAIGKAAAIAQTAINTFLAASDMFNKIQGAIPPPLGQILGGVAAAIVVAAGAKQSLKIAGISTSVPSPKEQRLNVGGMVDGMGVGDSVPALLTPGESVINANSTSMFRGLLSEINEAGGGVPFAAQGLMPSVDSSSGQNTPIIKAYVVSTDISNQQEFDRKVVSRSTL